MFLARTAREVPSIRKFALSELPPSVGIVGAISSSYGKHFKPTLRLNEQVKRNKTHFPEDFMFQLTEDEYTSLRSQIAILEKGRGKHRKYLPFVFTEQGIAMLSSVLNSERAVQVNIEIMRAFVLLRDPMTNNKELAQRLTDLERKYGEHNAQFKIIFDAIREIVAPVSPIKKRRIGF